MKNRLAFTLIELLVVIAIIAILAAILFPVFAQAKLAAKGASSVSNGKQIALAVMMYSNDYDDGAPLAQEWGDPDAQYNIGIGFSPWSYQVQPYTKNSKIFEDPLVGDNNGDTGSNTTVWDGYNPQYGYNYELMSPPDLNMTVDGDQGTSYGSATLTSMSRPANMVMATLQFQHNTATVCCIVSGVPGIMANWEVESPDCNDYPYGCFDNWGTGGWYVDWLQDNYVEGAYTGGVALRKTGDSIVMFTDGHVKVLSPGALAIGTNYTQTLNSGNIQLIGDYKDTYMWWQY
jgi:prepilin-type N-terminal cleavage/methylation domain-containing protein